MTKGSKPPSLFLSSCRWIEKVNLRVRATCANPPELKGRKVKDVQVFRACPGGQSLPAAPDPTPPKPAKAPKANKPKPTHLGAHHMTMLKAKMKPGRSSGRTPAAGAPRGPAGA